MTSSGGIRPLSDDEKIAVRQKWLDELYLAEGQRIWIAHAEKQGWSLDYQLQRLEQLVTGAYA